MPGEPFLFAIAALGVTLAGFAGLITSLHSRHNAHQAVQAYRVRNIVWDGFGLTLASLGAIAVHGFTQDVKLAVRVATIVLIVSMIRILQPRNLSGPAWEGYEGSPILAIVLPTVLAIVIASVSPIWASPGFLQVLIVVILTGPFTIFYRTVRDTFDENPSRRASRRPRLVGQIQPDA